MKRNEQRCSRRGIRSRVMAYLVGFVAFLIGLLWLFQVVWLDEFYRWDKTRQMKSAAHMLALHTQDGEINELMEYVSARNAAAVMMLDEQMRVVYVTDQNQEGGLPFVPGREIEPLCRRAPESGAVLTALTALPGLHEQFPAFSGLGKGMPVFANRDMLVLQCVRRITLPDGGNGFLVLSTVITPLDSTVETLRTQLTMVTVVLLIAAVALAWMIARRVAQPIIRVNDAARALSRGRYDPPETQGAYREIAELNVTLTDAAHELGQVEHLQNELIANISHDLRTPLTMIGGYAEVMRDIPGEANAENFQIIIDETNRLTSLVSELLDFSRLQSGNAAMTMVDFDLTDAIRAIVQRVSAMTEVNGYTVTFAPDEAVVTHADETRISQVVYNLLGNALTYTGADKTVTITQTVQGDSVRIAVADTGKGIPPEELPRIWHRYYRTKESHRRAVIGSGLGLSIVEGVLEKHGARFGVESVRIEADPVNHGSTFWFELPVVTLPEEIAGE